MIIQLVSDLHLEHRPYTQKIAKGADVLVIAGDFCPPLFHGRLVNLLKSLVSLPIVVCMGNHDYYDAHFDGRDFKEVVSRFPNVHLLDNSFVDIAGVRFVGGTLWSDFRLFGEDYVERSKFLAQRNISDFACIAAPDKAGYRRVTPDDMVAEHTRCVDAIRLYGRQAPGQVVMVTHFLPLPKSIHPQFANSALNAYFASDCSRVIDEVSPVLALHGHTHSAADYTHGATRVVCNPRGYNDAENTSFNSTLTIEIP